MLQNKTSEGIMQKQLADSFDMKLRPHHIIDIISGYGKDSRSKPPHPYGHSLHLVAPKIVSKLNLIIKLVLKADDVCTGCKHLLPGGKCNDVLGQLKPSPSKQAYNDVLDSRLFDMFALEPNCILTTRKYLELINDKTPGIEKICTHPKENQDERLESLTNGLIKLGIRKK